MIITRMAATATEDGSTGQPAHSTLSEKPESVCVRRTLRLQGILIIHGPDLQPDVDRINNNKERDRQEKANPLSPEFVIHRYWVCHPVYTEASSSVTKRIHYS